MRKQRLSNEALKKFRDLKLGVFFHFGLSTFVGEERPFGEIPVDLYNPKELNVDQWIRVIKEAGAKYAVLTSKHVSGHCLWPTKYTDYSVKNSPVKTDVVKEFIAACQKHDISPGIYYCSWDNHNLFGSLTPECKNGTWETAYVTEEYIKFQENQMDELFENYEGIKEFWLDIPRFIPRGVRERWYDKYTQKYPDIIYVSNNGFTDEMTINLNNTWPTDVITIESHLPRNLPGPRFSNYYLIEGQQYYIPGEVCDIISNNWFYTEDDVVRPDKELLGMYLVSQAWGANLLLNVPPNKDGILEEKYVKALMKLRENIDLIESNNK